MISTAAKVFATSSKHVSGSRGVPPRHVPPAHSWFWA
eukprot:CAMPEP_0180529636 /NCGR_PEP_ID=MMETSP1036_2-20121128/61484_1 /TAXON_ID=632150 /ORGANISM="Azadinium spinosum, Strain 3D9" /LENGTH=36 /DNA_ID= /DNA_START= /DNA_END= /DNA_ORIENTATION=